MTLVNISKYTYGQTKETLKSKLLQHTIKYHETRDLIILEQNQQELAYVSLLYQYKLLGPTVKCTRGPDKKDMLNSLT